MLDNLSGLSLKREYSNLFSYQTLHLVLIKRPWHMFFTWMNKSHISSKQLINPASLPVVPVRCPLVAVVVKHCPDPGSWVSWSLQALTHGWPCSAGLLLPPPAAVLPLMWDVWHQGQVKIIQTTFEPRPFSTQGILVYHNSLGCKQ